MAGIPGLNPGTTKASGSYIDWAKYSTSLRPGTRSAARPPIPARSGNRSAPVRPTRVAGKAESLGVHDLAADRDHLVRGQVRWDHNRRRRRQRLRSEAPSGRRSHRTRSSRGRGAPMRATTGIVMTAWSALPCAMRRLAADPSRHQAPCHRPCAALSPLPARAHTRGRSCRLVIQNTKPISRKNASTVTETTDVAKPRVGVKASAEVSRMTP